MRKIYALSLILLAPLAQAQQVFAPGIKPLSAYPALRESPMLRDTAQDRDHIVTFTDSQKVDITNNNNKVILTGGAQIRRSDSILKADTIEYDRRTGETTAIGNARLLRNGFRVTGTGLKYNVNQKTGEIESPVYRLNQGGSGYATRGIMLDDNHMRLDEAVYSSCECDDKFWYIKSKTVDIYNDENEGIARDGTLYIKGVPVFWSPYLSFPVRAERKTGLLMPTFAYTSRSGYEYTQPYYINLAPNYDLTLNARGVSKRGLMLGGEFRYLRPSYSGIWSGTYLPQDRMNKIKRWSYSISHRQPLGQVLGFNLGLNVFWNDVSDDDYYRDFTDIAAYKAERTFLNQNIALTFSGHQYWSGHIMLRKYRALNDFTSDSPRRYFLYESMPEIRLRGARYDWNGFDLTTENYISRFVYPTYFGSVLPVPASREGHILPDGTRYSSYTNISYPIVRSGWYLTPKLGIHASHYDTNWYPNLVRPFVSQAGTSIPSITRVLPIASVDAGMMFERKTSLFGKPRIQTLEPRIYYVYIPYKYQSDIPIFDTSVSQFGFGTAFSENRYSGGWDRINAANQITLGLTSRWLDEETGNERMVAQIAQRFYFKKQKVTLSNAERFRTQGRSEILGNLSVALTDTFNPEIGVQYDPYERKIAQTYASIRWFPKRLTSLSMTYRYQRDPFTYENAAGAQTLYPYQLAGKEYVSLAGQWPITKNVYAVGRYDYSLREKRTTQSILGLEYKGDCCWIGRVVLQRYAVSKTKTNSAIFVQLELNGLGAVGADPMETLRDSIPGYQNIKDPQPVYSTFERYE